MVYCAHAIAMWTTEKGTDFALPGFVCDPSWVRVDKTKSGGTRYWPHAMNVNGVANDLGQFLDQFFRDVSTPARETVSHVLSPPG